MNIMAHRLQKCLGASGKLNDILFFGHSGSPTANLIYFGGDIQDYESNMRNDLLSRSYVKWNLENTACLLYKRFCAQFEATTRTCNPHVWIIRASKFNDGLLACYNNFLKFTHNSVPIYENKNIINLIGLEHLTNLLINAGNEINQLGINVTTKILNNPIYLIGFSKGCCVITELFYELCNYCQNLNESSTDNALKEFISSITNIYWLDGGHSGHEHLWPVSAEYISLIKPEVCPQLHIDATPFQILNPDRRLNARDFHRFIEILSSHKLPYKKTFHFMISDDLTSHNIGLHTLSCNIETHFDILNYFTF